MNNGNYNSRSNGFNSNSQMMQTGIINPNQMNRQNQMMRVNNNEFNPNASITRTGEFIPNQLFPYKNNPFFDPSMNTYEFDIERQENAILPDFYGKVNLDLKLEELQRLYNRDLISNQEYIIKKTELINEALDNL